MYYYNYRKTRNLSRRTFGTNEKETYMMSYLGDCTYWVNWSTLRSFEQEGRGIFWGFKFI